jgi:hypothetical protein
MNELCMIFYLFIYLYIKYVFNAQYLYEKLENL